jgi:hypothetical protein
MAEILVAEHDWILSILHKSVNYCAVYCN